MTSEAFKLKSLSEQVKDDFIRDAEVRLQKRLAREAEEQARKEAEEKARQEEIQRLKEAEAKALVDAAAAVEAEAKAAAEAEAKAAAEANARRAEESASRVEPDALTQGESSTFVPLTKPHTLIARIFKVRYYPRLSYFDVNLGFNPSFVWRSIWNAKEVLSLGCRWSIGDGSHIMVMNEPWIQGKREGCLSGPHKQGAYDIKVKDLMLPNVKQWDMRVIRQLFNFADAKEILQMTLLEDGKEDKMIWKEEQNGSYSVRSGYRLWRSSRMSSENGFRQHYVSCPSIYQLCENNLEDDWHLFFGCTEINQCWRAVSLSFLIDIRLHSFHDVKSLIFDICSKEDMRDAGRFAVQDTENAQHYPMIWNPPMDEGLKCSVDATFNYHSGTTNRGWRVRDNLRNFIIAGVAWDIGSLSVIEAEAMPFKEAILEAVELHL
ncbi:hypothetical protein KIW84_071094 [Lathyrus oleraceus]|uniref:Reverse transcriptase zinc-binding domain-containing protein n=1 Tax=Pisum sativum TaxID=3888 RepID=A0A9D4VIL0_PEA|nr:hypothetical protein KIW84_071094 [Pisum sativum]